MSDKERPNCYKCKHRRTCAGSEHSSCSHPETAKDLGSGMGSLMATFASVGRVAPVAGSSALKLGIKANDHGVRSGWFNWPWNFDPIWLEACNGFEAKP